MPDNFVANPGSGGDTFAADEIAGIKYPRSKVGFGADGAYSDVSTSNRLPVDVGTVPVTGPLTDAQLRASAVPVSAASLPLPAGAATQATLATVASVVQAEDSPHVSAANGIMMLAVRQDAVAPMGADGDYTPLQTNGAGHSRRL